MNRFVPYLAFFFLLIIPFTAYFVRPDMVGHDTYGFLALVCHEKNVVGADGLTFLLFNALPCNILALKVLLFCLAFVSGCFVIKLATLFSPERGWTASFLLFLSSVFVLEFTKLENDQFAYPILFASLYFFYYSVKKSSRKHFALSLLLLGLAGLFWSGAAFYLFAYSLVVFPLIVVTIPIAFFFRKNIFGIVFRLSPVAENLPFKFHLTFLLNFGLLGWSKSEDLLYPGVFLFILGVLSNKFWILSIPFLVVGMVKLLELFKREEAFHVAALISIVLVFALTQSVLLNPPQQQQWEAIDYAIEQAEGEEVNNPWGWGYWVKWMGGETKSYQSLERQSLPEENQVTISESDLNCVPLKRFDGVAVYKC